MPTWIRLPGSIYQPGRGIACRCTIHDDVNEPPIAAGTVSRLKQAAARLIQDTRHSPLSAPIAMSTRSSHRPLLVLFSLDAASPICWRVGCPERATLLWDTKTQKKVQPCSRPRGRNADIDGPDVCGPLRGEALQIIPRVPSPDLFSAGLLFCGTPLGQQFLQSFLYVSPSHAVPPWSAEAPPIWV